MTPKGHTAACGVIHGTPRRQAARLVPLLLAASFAAPASAETVLLVRLSYSGYYSGGHVDAYDFTTGMRLYEFMPDTETKTAARYFEGPDGNFYGHRANIQSRLDRYEGLSGASLGQFAFHPDFDWEPGASVFSASGDLLVADGESNTVIRFGPDGSYLGPVIAPANQGEYLKFGDLVVGPDGHLYALSAGLRQIRRYDGTTYAPLAHFPIHSVLERARSMAFSPAGDIFVTERGTEPGSGRILRFSGSDGSYLGAFVAGVGIQPAGLAFGPDGHLYVSTSNDGRIFRFDGETGASLGSFGPHVVPTHSEYGPFLTTGSLVFTDLPGPIPGVTKRIDAAGDGVHPLDAARGLSVAPDGTAVVTSSETDDVFRVAPGGTVSRILTAAGDGAGATVDRPIATAIAPDGSVFVASHFTHSVFRVDPLGVVTRILAGGIFGPLDLAVDLVGNVFVVSNQTDTVVRVTPSGVRSDIIGPAGDGTGNVLDNPIAVAVDRHGSVYVAGQRSNNVFRIAPGGAITEIVDASGDGAGHPLDYPVDVVVDSRSNVYVSAALSDNVLRIAPDGTIEQVAWFPTTPKFLALDKLDHLFVALGGIDEVVMVTAAGEQVPIVRRGGAGAGGQLINPTGLAVDDAGRVYVSGLETNNVLRADVSPECSNGVDDDGDGFVDYPEDPGCYDAMSIENPACDDDIDNDGDGKIDWDGGSGGAIPDPQCTQPWRDRESASCGLGFELALVLAPLGLLLRRRARVG